MHIFNDVFEKELIINRVNKPEQKLDRSLDTIYSDLNNLVEEKDIKSAVSELKDYMTKTKKF